MAGAQQGLSQKPKAVKRKIASTFLGEFQAPLKKAALEFDEPSQSTSTIVSANVEKEVDPNLSQVYKIKPSDSLEEITVKCVTDRVIVESVSEQLKIQKKNGFQSKIPLPQLQNLLSVNLRTTDRNDVVLVQVQNTEKKEMHGATLKAIRKGNALKWNCVLFEGILSLTANEFWTVIVSSGNSSNVYDTKSGFNHFCCVMEEKISLVTLNGNFCMMITEDVKSIVWDLSKKKIIYRHDFDALLLNRNLSIVKASLTDFGVPVVILNNGEVFYFNHDEKVWVQIESNVNALASLSVYFDVIQKSIPYGLISRICFLSKDLKKPDVCSTIKPNEEKALEQLMQALAWLKSPEEFRIVFVLYVQRCLANGSKNKLNALMKSLPDLAGKVGYCAEDLKQEVSIICEEFGTTFTETESQVVVVDDFDDIGFL